jgi:MinD superfamily P-loop ATPase
MTSTAPHCAFSPTMTSMVNSFTVDKAKCSGCTRAVLFAPLQAIYERQPISGRNAEWCSATCPIETEYMTGTLDHQRLVHVMKRLDATEKADDEFVVAEVVDAGI